MALVKLTRLLAWLNKSPIKETDNALYQTIRELVREMQILRDTVVTLSPTAETTIINNPTNFILLGSDTDSDNYTIPGEKGLTGEKGDVGAGGPAGPTTIGPMGIDGEDGADGMPIPGSQGSTGNTGSQGPVGPPTIGPMGLNGEDGEDGYPIPGPAGSSGSGAVWTLIAEQVAAGAANYDFIDLVGYNEIRVVLVAVTPSGATEVTMLVSIDNGASFLATTGDYVVIGTNGAPTNSTNLRFYAGGAAAARYGQIVIHSFNKTSIKVAISHMDAAFYMRFIPTANALNAIRVRVTSGTINSGTIFVFGR